MHQPFLLGTAIRSRSFDKILRDDLDRALATLPEHHRIVVILSDLEEFSYGEIAATLAVPVGTVRSRLARARGTLQKILWQQARDAGLSAAPPVRNEREDGKADAPRPATARQAARAKKDWKS
jgi:RNA polymerase sigma-70 factor (ECF subfamily)